MNQGSYTKDATRYEQLLEQMYEDHLPITFPPEYAYFAQENMLQWLIRLARYKFVVRQLRRQDNILEVGCGSGLGAIFMGQHCNSVHGIDVKKHEISEARSINRRDNVSFSLVDFFEYRSEHKYDAIVMLDVIEHMEERLGREMVSKTRELLAEDGLLVIGTPSCYSYEHQSEFSKAGHVKLYDQQELVDLVEKYYGRALRFSMNDEMVHTGFAKLAWYYLVLAFLPGVDG